jgi:hypothetical protein
MGLKFDIFCWAFYFLMNDSPTFFDGFDWNGMMAPNFVPFPSSFCVLWNMFLNDKIVGNFNAYY